MRRMLAAAVLGLLALALGCGKYGPPVRAPRPSYDEGTIYDAGQPTEPGTRKR